MEQVDQAVVDGEVTCFECLYDLRGQPIDGRCPECGAAVAVALREDRWDRADPAWRRTVRRGAAWAAGEYLVVLAVLLFTLLTRYDPPWIGAALYGSMGVCSLIGSWMMTAREPGVDRVQRRPWRGWVRGLAVYVALVYALIATVLLLPHWARSAVGWRWEQWILASLTLSNGPKLAVQLWGMVTVLGRVPGGPLRRAARLWAWTPLIGWLGVLGMWWISTMWPELRVAALIGILIAFLATAGYEVVLWWVLRARRDRA